MVRRHGLRALVWAPAALAVLLTVPWVAVVLAALVVVPTTAWWLVDRAARGRRVVPAAARA